MNRVMTMYRRGRRSRYLSLLPFAAVIAVIAGLLAMHSLSLEDDPAATVTTIVTVAPPSAGVDATSVDAITPMPCEGAICESGHAAGTATCLLALLTLLLLLLPTRAGWADLLARIRHLCMSSPHADSVSSWFRPSLVALSISRT